GGLDLDTVIKASQAISGEIDLNQLIKKMLDIIVENAGAQKACLILENSGQLSVEAVGTAGEDEVRAEQSVPVELSLDVSPAIVNYVRRTRESVVLGDAVNEGQFTADAYVLENQPKSVLCMPITGQARLVGILYLENDLTTDAFTLERLKVLDVLASQAAISLENARLYDQMEQRVIERTAQLEAATEDIKKFSYSVSHDLRAPLRSIDGFSQALLEDYGNQLDVLGQDYLQRVRKATQRMGQLIDDLLQFSRIQRVAMRCDQVDLSALAWRVAKELQQAHPERQVDFVIADGLVVEGDGNLLHRVLDNLMGNAWKFTRQKIPARIEFGCIETDGAPTYFVRDNGAGFDMAYASNLFGLFQRLHPDEEFEGTGVGLASVERIIRRHNGQVSAEGEVGRGASFYFTLGKTNGQDQ
ncbi:MAG: ATP-binding protein, partial [Anaerolineae bacterium]